MRPKSRKSKNTYFFLFIILVLASFLRLYKLGSNPPSLDWDEASLGYNAYSILKTGNDEFGNHLPFSIRSFNDYKPPLYVYATIPSIALFGLSEFSVRLPSAIAGVIAVLSIYFIAQEIIPKENSKSLYSYIAISLIAINPWHLQFSRGAFEANLALTCFLVSVSAYLKWKSKKTLIYILISAVFATASLYAYHSTKIVVPTFFIILGIAHHKSIFKNTKHFLLALSLALVLASPLIYITLRPTSSSRFNTVSVFTNPGEFSREREKINRIADFKAKHSNFLQYFHTQKATMTKIVTRNYFEHFNFDFLFLRADGNPRHHVPNIGVVYLVNFPFLLYGAYKLIESKPKNSSVIWLFLLTGPLAASLTASTPHAIRAYSMLAGFILLIAYGYYCLFQKIKTSKPSLIVFLLFSSFLFFNFLYYLNLYYTIYPHTNSQDWQYGYKQLVEYITPNQDQFDQIIVTNHYDQPHIYFAFYQQINPSFYQQFAESAHQHISNISFKTLESQDFETSDSLIAVEPERTPADANIIHQINFLNGIPAFNLIQTN